MNEVIPGILEQTPEAIIEKAKIVRPFSKSLHIDVIDGKFAPNTTVTDPTAFKELAQEFFLEVHLMVEEPITYVESFASAGFKRFIGHIEHMANQERFIAEAQLVGEAVLAIDGKTPLSQLTKDIYDLDGILVMTINAGFSGQQFQYALLEKVAKLRATYAGVIEVDGGINEKTLVLGKEAGANRFVSTSCIFTAENPRQMYETLVSR